MRCALIIALTLFVGSQALGYTSGGHSYDLSCNSSGYILTSKYPVSRFVEAGASSWNWEGREKIYLGRSCDAFHELFGSGNWCWANGGFVADFSNASFGFPRQELFCDAHNEIGISCRC